MSDAERAALVARILDDRRHIELPDDDPTLMLFRDLETQLLDAEQVAVMVLDRKTGRVASVNAYTDLGEALAAMTECEIEGDCVQILPVTPITPAEFEATIDDPGFDPAPPQ